MVVLSQGESGGRNWTNRWDRPQGFVTSNLRWAGAPGNVALSVKDTGGRLGAIFRYAGTPLADQVPADWQDKVMHGSLTES